MVKSSVNKKSYPICFQCGSQLIFVSQETVQLEGTRYPQTNTVYRCSNDACQEKKDKDKADRLKLRQTREITEKERTEKIQEKRRLNQKLKMQGN
jgi:hypothetical protein